MFSNFRGRLSVALIALLVAGALMPKPARAITPEDPRVKARVKSALGFLATVKEERLGGICLIALCFKKADQDGHPAVARAIKSCYDQDVKLEGAANNYSLGIALMFLCEIDDGQGKHKDLINKYVDELLSRQKKFGAWTYSNFQTGDTSQTQYACLGMWFAKNYAHRDIPVEAMEGVCGWLMRCQDVGGGWPYQGTDPGAMIKANQGESVSVGLSAAGGGSLYVMADLLQVTKSVETQAIPKSKALQTVVVPGAKDDRAPLVRTLNTADIKSSLELADRKMGTGFTPQAYYNNYSMYALERFHAFREKAGGKPDNRWYDEGFEYLSKTQQANGSWVPPEGSDEPSTSTCFATLFLLRSAKKAIVKKFGDGIAVARMGLPKDVKSIQLGPGGRIIDPGVVIPTDQIIQLINSSTESEEVTRLAEEKEALILSSDKTERESQLKRLRDHVGAGSFNVRMVAVTTLGKDRNLENVPRLLYALTDPDPQIVWQADKGLRFISRKVDGVGLPMTEPSKDQKEAAKKAWTAWYLSIRPNAELLD